MKLKFANKYLQALAVAAMCGSVLVSSCLVEGCTPAQKQTTLQVVTAINQHIPEVVAAADTVAATVELLDPASAALLSVGDATFDTLAKTLQVLTAAYIANPNASTLQQIQTAINTLESNINTATLNAVGIKDVESQRLAVAALHGLLTVVTIVFGMIAPTESVTMLYQLRSTGTIHLAQVRPYMDAGELAAAGKADGVDVNEMFKTAEAFGF
jgi:hypothetical protein